MMAAVFWYELRNWLRQPAFYAYWIIFYLLSLLLFVGDAGLFEGSFNELKAGDFVSSPERILRSMQYLLKPLLFTVPAVLGATIYRDFQYRVYPFLYSYPIRETPYLLGKMSAGFLLVVFIGLGIGMALLTGEWILRLNHGPVGDYGYGHYLKLYLLYILPNLLICGLLVFTIVALSRNIFSGFWMLILILFLAEVADKLPFTDTYLQILPDPFGDTAISKSGSGQGQSDIHHVLNQFSTPFFINRLTWLSLSALAFLWLIRTFRFRYPPAIATPGVFSRKVLHISPSKNTSSLPLNLSFGSRHHLKALLALSRLNRNLLFRHWLPAGFSVVLAIILVLTLLKVAQGGPLNWRPVTRIILYLPAFITTQMISLFTFIGAAMLGSQNIEGRVSSLTNPTPVKTWVLPLSNFIALLQLQCVLLGVFILTGIGFQFFTGVWHFQPERYLIHITFYMLPPLLVWNALSIVVLALVRRIYPALFILLLFWLGSFAYDSLGIDSSLLRFNEVKIPLYSSFNAYGPTLSGDLLVRAYWITYTALLMLAGILVWPRELFNRISERRIFLKQRFTQSMPGTIAALSLALILLGSVIYQEESKAYSPLPKKVSREDMLRPFSHLYQRPQPRITRVKVQVNIFPDERRFELSGQYRLENKSQYRIDSLIIRKSYDEVTDFSLSRPSSLVLTNSNLRVDIYRLNKPLFPGDSLDLYFEIHNTENNAFQQNSNIISNGSLLHDDIMPRLGLPFPPENIAPEAFSSQNHYQATDSDLLWFEALVSTAEDQVALSTGELLATWTENERNYFSYRSKTPVKFNFYFASGSYVVKKLSSGKQNLEIYHHPAHTKILESLEKGWRASLIFNQQLFGAEPAGNWRILEYPIHRGTSNTLIDHTLLISEQLFAIASSSAGSIDFPFYIAAHECTHHWFGNQLLPAYGDGATMLTESVTEYLSLKIYEREYGSQSALDFLKLQHQRYFQGRTKATEEEPLVMVKKENEYLAYGKGAIAFNALASYWGEENFNRFLSHFFHAYARTQIYPPSVFFLDSLNAELPDSLVGIADDFFRESCTYDLQLRDLNLKELPSGEIELVARIFYLTGESKSCHPVRKLPVQLQLLDQEGKAIIFKTVLIEGSGTKVRIVCSQKPGSIVLDPGFLLLDPQRDNNKVGIK